MKKNYFLKVLALAVVAMISTFAISCSEEDLSINGGDVDFPEIPELAEPMASLAVTVVDFESRETLKYEVIDVSASIGQTITVKCPTIEGYTTANSVNVAIPAIKKGQAIVIPVTFYVVTIESAIDEILEELDGSLPVDSNVESVIEEISASAKGELEMIDNVITNTTEEAVEMTISIPFVSGYKYRGDATTISSRSLTEKDFRNIDFEKVTETYKFTIPSQTRIAFIPTQIINPVVLTLSNGEVVNLWEAGAVDLSYKSESLSHDHGHDHGHGSGNAGGGIGGDNAGE